MHTEVAATGESTGYETDLGPLAWVLDELRKSLDGATKALRRFVRDAEFSRGSDLAALDGSQLRIARQQLHQAVGALEMVGLEVPAKMLRAMESLVQKFVQKPEFCSDEAALKVERASFALTDYLEGLLKGKALSSVALFPQFRDVLELVGEDRVHPADLWPLSWRWVDVELPSNVAPMSYDSTVRTRIDGYILNVVKTGHVPSARAMCDISLGFAKAQADLHPRVLWAIAAAYFEVVSLGLCAPDIYAKRAASRVLLQYRTLARGEPDISERLVQDLLFFCAQAVPAPGQDAAALRAVQLAYGIAQASRVDYDKPQFGRFDPAALAQARKRIVAATETWSSLSGGDISRIKTAVDQFSLVADSITKLHPDSGALAVAMSRALDSVSRSGAAPAPALAMEVATAVLYLEAAYEDLDPTNEEMVRRGNRLAQRLDHVVAGGQPEPLDGWMEELYRRVSDRQTMGSVVDELRTTLGEVETALDTYFRRPDDKLPLHEVPGQLAQMRGVFSVLGLDQAALAALRMRDSVERCLVDTVVANASGVFEKLGNSLGALGFLIDMLSYQRELAKKLFVYDEKNGEFRSLMGRQKDIPETSPPEPEPEPEPKTIIMVRPAELPQFAQGPIPAVVPVAVVPAPVPIQPQALTTEPTPAVPDAEEDDDAELLEIFLEEAREVVQSGLGAILALEKEPADLDQQTSLRRSFHTLKGSARMVGLNEFGEAAWALEQLLNAWLPQQLPATLELLKLAGQAMNGFGSWIEDIASGSDAPWRALPFRQAADQLRLENTGADLVLPKRVAVLQPEVEPAVELSSDEPLASLDAADVTEINADFSATQMLDFGDTQMLDFDQKPAASPAGADVSGFLSADEASAPDLLDISFDDLLAPVRQAKPEDLVAAIQPDEALPELDDVLAPAVLTELPDVLAELDAPEPELAEPDLLAPPPLASADPLEGLVTEPESNSDDQVKVVGSLRIGLALYNVYLNEADEWSRRLLTELSEWSLELDQRLPDSAIALAHSLAGSSATVGFAALSELARALEHAMEHTQMARTDVTEQAHLFSEVAEDIRRLLHQFAAGFLKQPDPEHLAALRAILDIDFSASIQPEPDAQELAQLLSDFDLEPEAVALAPAVEKPAAQPVAPATATPEVVAEAEAEEAEAGADLVADAEAEAEADAEAELETDAEANAEVGADSVAEAEAEPEAEAKAVESISEAEPPEPEIEAIDLLDVDLFPIFEEEALELLPKLGSALRQWSSLPDNLSARQEALRVLHTLKGSARLAGAMRLGEMAHRMETAAERIDTETAKSQQVDPLLARLDHISNSFETLRAMPVSALVLPESVSLVRSVPGAEDDVQALPAVVLASTSGEAIAQAVVAPASIAAPRRLVGQTIRVKSQLVDRMVNQVGEVMITRSRLESRLGQLRGSLEELTGNLERLRRQLHDMETQSESQMQSRLAQTKEATQAFDPLEFDRFTRVQELTRMMAESVHDVATLQRSLQQTVEGVEDDLIAQARLTRDLQHDLLRARMVEFESIAERLHGVVRQAAKDFDKPAKLEIVGGSIDLDRGVLERVVLAFEHLLRNAVGHGIETAAVRAAAGKPPVGVVNIKVEHQSNDVAVTFSDDGAGLDLDRIRAKAVTNGQIAAGQTLSDAQIADLIFTSGLSTASEVSEMAGRGIGMDVVRTEVNGLGGRIELSTQSGQGTQFKLVLPLTTAVTQVVLLRMGEVVMGVPSSLVEIVRRVPVADLEAAYESGRFDYNGDGVAFFWAGALLQISAASVDTRGKTAIVAVFQSAGHRVAMHVDEILGNQEAVVKNLGPQLSRLPGLAGMTVLASGAVVLIYNPVALASSYGEQARSFGKSTSVAQPPLAGGAMSSVTVNQLPLVLVVDDSITVRRVTQRLLKREGYRVALANDGLHALEVLQLEKPSVVLTDIEMPRMDGFDLVRNIRADENLKNLPIIMITSRIAEKHRDYARTLNVDHYLGKPYPEDELIALVRGYCAVPVEATVH